jgi:hypothetical protein
MEKAGKTGSERSKGQSEWDLQGHQLEIRNLQLLLSIIGVAEWSTSHHLFFNITPKSLMPTDPTQMPSLAARTP